MKKKLLDSTRKSFAQKEKVNFLLMLFFIFFSLTNNLFSQGTKCDTATSITVNGACITSSTANITDATQNTPTATGCSIGTFRREGWYTFTVTGGPLDITITAESNNRNLFLQLISSTSACTGLTQIACANDDTANNSAQTETITQTLSNGIYYIKVLNVGGDNNMRLNSICVTGSAASGYCTPSSTNTSDYISSFATTGGVVNITNNSEGLSGTGYGNFYNTHTVSQYPGSSLNFTETYNDGSHGFNIWVDWNNDGTFATGERVFISGATATGHSGSFTVPGGQAAGDYRMRIRGWWNNNNPDPCTSISYGEAEDYKITILTLPACSGMPNAGTVVTTPISGAPGSNYTVSASGFTNASGITYQWQYSTNGGSNWNNAGSATSIYSNYTATAPSVGTTVLWQLVVNCTNSGLSATSSNGTFTSVSSLNVPATGSNTVSCGTNTTLYDNGGPSGNYDYDSYGYTILEAGIGATIHISGNYSTESGYDYIYIYSGSGTGGTLLASYSGTGTINYTGTAGQTLTVQLSSDDFNNDSGFALSVTYSGTCYSACSGTPTGGTVTTSPTSGDPGSSYTVSASGFTIATGLNYQWQSNTNSAGWVNVGTATATYANYNATAPGTIGTTVAWRLVITCTASGQSANSATSTFTSTSTLNIPTTGSNSVTCGTNITLYDNGGPTGDYAYSSTGYTVLEAGVGATINISGSYNTESSYDYINIYSGVGTGGTLLASYDGSGSINYTGTAGQTLTVQFTSDSFSNYSGFSLSVTYSGVCYPACSGTPTGGTVTTNPNSDWPGANYVVSATGYTQALNLTYQWQYSTDAGATWSNAGAATSSYANYTATAPASGDVHWQLVVTCTNSGQSATSVTGVFVTMAVSDVETGCPNVVSGGLGLSGADPNPFNCYDSSTCVDLEATYLDLGETTDYIVEPIAYNPPYNFDNLANPISVNDDDVWSDIINLPFDFCFYGNSYNQCLVGSNGVLTFDLTSNIPNDYCDWDMFGSSTGANLPVSGHSALVENAIFGVFHDIDPENSGEVGWELVTLPTGCRALVVSWSNVPMYSNDTTNDYTGMMVLYENSNIIEVYVEKKRITNYSGWAEEDDVMWNDGNAVIGIQNATGTLATVPPGRNVLDANWTAYNEAWRFVPNGNSIATLTWHEGSGVSGPIIGSTDILNVCPTSTTTYTAEITYTLCDGSTLTETDETTVTVNGAKVWNGSVSTAWDNDNNWTPNGKPTAMDCVVIPVTPNDPIVSGTGYNGLGLNMSIQNDATLTVNTDNAITITDWVNISTTGNLVLDNAASLIQINTITNSGAGAMHMDRDVNIRKLDYVYWSSPVTSFASNLVSPNTTGYIYKWTPTISSNLNGFGNWVSGIENMTVGKGYIIRGPNNYTSTLQNFTATFAGTPNNGTLTTPIQRGSYVGPDYNTCATCTIATQDDDNWNLVGNPYPSAIDAIDFLTTNTNIEGFIKLWTHGTLPDSAIADPFYDSYVYNYTPGDYLTYNASGTSSGPGVFNGSIAAGQGFFVLMKDTGATSETISFDNTMRSHLYDNGEFFRTANNNHITPEKNRIWLDLISSSNNSSVRTLVGYIDGATNDQDRLFDAITDKKIALNIFSLINDERMTIQGRQTPFNIYDQVPIGINIPTDGQYSIGIGALDGLFTNSQDIYLEDLENNIIHDLKTTPYSFYATQGINDNRFVLRYTTKDFNNQDLNNLENNIWTVSQNELTVKSTNTNIKNVKVFDVLGRLMTQKENVNSNTIVFESLLKSNSTLILQIELENGTTVNKKVIF